MLFFRPRSAVLARLELVGHEHVEQAAAEGKGVLLLSAHLGNWELLAPAHALTAFELSVVVRPLDEPLLHRLADRFRRRTGSSCIRKRRGLGEVLEALRRGRLVGHPPRSERSRTEGVFAPFFGVPASTSKGLALISLRTGAPVLPIFIRRMEGGRHRVEADAPVSRARRWRRRHLHGGLQPRHRDGDPPRAGAVVLDARPLEDAASPGDIVTGRTLLALASAFFLVAAGGALPPGAEDRRAQVSPYLRALEARAVGEIDGRAYGEPRRPSAPALPYEGVSLLALPYAADVDAHLDAIKRQQRDSMANYTETHGDVTAVREAYDESCSRLERAS